MLLTVYGSRGGFPERCNEHEIKPGVISFEVHTTRPDARRFAPLTACTNHAVRDLRVRAQGDHEPKGRRAAASQLVAPGGAADAWHGTRSSAAGVLQRLFEKRPSYGGRAGVRGLVPQIDRANGFRLFF